MLWPAMLLAALGLFAPLRAAAEQNVVVVIIDGARYSETFGDPQRNFIPQMGRLALEGAIVDPFYNDNYTYTSRAIPALWCGAWTAVRDTVYQGIATQTALLPTIFEYFRRQQSAPAEQCYYVLKSIRGLWLPSFHQEYGPAFWPTYHSVGITDEDVLIEALEVMETHHPQLLLVYLADVDGAGHSGDWVGYTGAIRRADSTVAVIWEALQSDSVYADNTTMLVTNDHGRHDDQHGGIGGHGDGCDGCRRIMFLALGPRIRQNFVSTEYHTITDFAVTAAALLDLDPEYATGEVIDEIFLPLNVESTAGTTPEQHLLHQNYPNPFNPTSTIQYDLPKAANVTLIIHDILGREVVRLVDQHMQAGSHQAIWDAKDHAGRAMSTGIYIARLSTLEYSKSIKMVLLK